MASASALNHDSMNSCDHDLKPLMEALQAPPSSEEEENFGGPWRGLGGGLEERSCKNMTIEITEELKEEVYITHI